MMIMMSTKRTRRFNSATAGLVILFAVGVALLAFGTRAALAQEADAVTQPQPLHPTFALLDADGNSVLDSAEPLSTIQTCGQCHDADFITSHSFHADVGLSDFGDPGTTATGREWDSSPGLFGKWDPLTYRYLSAESDPTIDTTTADWIRTFGARHVGGGPAVTSRSGAPLLALPADAATVDTHAHNPATGALEPWDWQTSGVVEMNCFLCHLDQPNNDARIAALSAGQFGWANSATLLGSGIVTGTADALTWNADAFDADGELLPAFVTVTDPQNSHCAQCHGLVHIDAETPLVTTGCSPSQWNTLTTGQIISPQRINDSGMNLADKETLARSFDVHAERVVDCVDCHYALNNPIYYQESAESRPDHLTFDPRRIDFNAYLTRPLHEFAKGSSAQGTLATELNDSLRRCDSCHSVERTHDWLPYKEQHFESVACESCHIPTMYSTARQTVDWTVITTDGHPQTECRGTDGVSDGFDNLITGFEPILLPRAGADGDTAVAPHNLITSWYWIAGDPPRPVPQSDLLAAYLDGDRYADAVVARFDADADGALTAAELRLDSDDKVSFMTDRLAALGLDNPRIAGEVQPYSISHTVAHGDWTTRDCRACHGDDSRLTAEFTLASYLPGGVLPVVNGSSQTVFNGEMVQSDDGGLIYRPNTADDALYILGHNSRSWVDWTGILLFLGVMTGVSAHGGLRYLAARRHVRHQPALKRVYMYTVYERLWHWLQTVTILLLLFTGLIIHKPDMFGIFSFSYVVQVHNVLAALLVINAALSLFYHLASGEIRQYLPRPRGFFDQAIEQTLFYVRGIFRGDEHPFEKTTERKLNPLQQITYFGILNVLLPLQTLTGLFMWGAQQWPNWAARLGGLPFLAPFHTLIAWLFASFIVAHVYLTTTGPTPLAGIKAMMLGWDDVELPSGSVPTTEDPVIS